MLVKIGEHWFDPKCVQAVTDESGVTTAFFLGSVFLEFAEMTAEDVVDAVHKALLSAPLDDRAPLGPSAIDVPPGRLGSLLGKAHRREQPGNIDTAALHWAMNTYAKEGGKMDDGGPIWIASRSTMMLLREMDGAMSESGEINGMPVFICKYLTGQVLFLLHRTTLESAEWREGDVVVHVVASGR